MENVNIFGETQGEIGSLDKNLVLRTRGQVYIRFGKKYIELLDSNGNLNVKIPKVIKKIKSNNEASSNGFYMLDGSIYAYIDGELIQLSSIENTSNNNLKLTVKNSEKTIADNFNILNFVGKNYIDFLIDWNQLGNNKTVNIGLNTTALDNKINNIEKYIKNISDRNYNIESIISNVNYLKSKLNVVESYFSITVSQSVITVQGSESTPSIIVDSLLDWNINNVSDGSWCHPSKLTSNILNIAIDPFSGPSRTAIITVSNGVKSKTVKIIQTGSGNGDSDVPLYTVGLLSDTHYQVPDSNGQIHTVGEATSSDNGSFYKEDLAYIIDQFKYYDTVFNASTGDIATNSLNELIEFTNDYIEGYTGVNQNYTGDSFLSDSNYKKLYCALGNHDHHIVYSDTSKCKYVNYNNGANTHDGQRWDSITYNNISYNCPGKLSGTVSYFSSNSKSYKITYNGDIYIFISAFYGDPRAASDDGQGHDMSQMHPHNQMTSTQISNLKSYIQQKYNNTYSFPQNESNFNFQYYKYEDLIELKDIIESNTSSRIFVFSHYYFPNKSGGNNEYPGGSYNGGASTCLMGITFHFLNCLNNKFKNVVWFTGHTHLSWMYSNAKKGLYWTNKNYKYVIPTSTDNSTILTNYTQDFYAVTTGNAPYNRLSNEVDADEPNCGWNIHLPSLSRPANSSGNNLPACEAAVMEVYSDRVEIKKLGYTRNNDGTYTSYGSQIPDRTLVIYNNGSGSNNDANPEIGENNNNVQVLNNQIGFVLENNTGETIHFTGRLRMFVGSSYGLHAGDSRTSETNFVFRNTRHYGIPRSSDDQGKYIYSGNPKVATDTYGHYDNTETLAPGQSMTLIYTDHTIDYSGSTGQLKNCDIYPNISNLSGKYFAFDSSNFNANTSQHIQNQTIKLSVAIDRSSSTYPNRVDQATGFYRTTLKNSTDFSNSIQTGRLYYISITKMEYNHGYVFSDCVTPTNSDKIDSSKVSITTS